jgi:hypothetical protein
MADSCDHAERALPTDPRNRDCGNQAISLGASKDNAGTRQTTKSGAGDGNRTHGSSLGSLGITIIRRPLGVRF